MSQAETSARPDPDPGGRTTTTAPGDAPPSVTDHTTDTAAPVVRIGGLDASGSGDGDGAGAADAPTDDPVHRRFWGEPEARADGARRARPRRGRRARRQQWVVRNISTWSVLKVSTLFFACMWAVLLVAGVVLWQVGAQAGLIGNAESFWAEATGSEEVTWDGEVVFRSAAMAGAVLAVASVAFAVLFSILFNLICDMTGGIRLTVLQVEPRRDAPRRGRRRG